MTPTRTWKSSATGNQYFVEYLVEILPWQAKLTVKSLIDGQEFLLPTGGGIYEGVAAASGTFLGQQVSGTAWNEQVLG